MLSRLSFVISFVLLIFSLTIYAQNNTKKQLELKRIELLREIKNTQNLINKSKDNKKLIFENIENLNYKLDLQNEIIRLNNNELNDISSSIEQNKIKIDRLIESQEILKKQYSEMILRSFKTRSKTQKLMFIFSSVNFQQALKRIQYFKQYSDYQNNQLLKIKSNTLELKLLEKSLLTDKQFQQNLILNNTKIKIVLIQKLMIKTLY
jgi:peptidoglycan hydrolase CwlO-like protein